MHNTVTANPEEATGAGGGILCHGYPWAYVAENEITNNKAGAGAGIAVEYSRPLIRDNTITDNTALYHGGGIYMEDSGGLVIRNEIRDNGLPVPQVIPDGTPTGGGIACVDCDEPAPLIVDNEITGNAARDDGGGMSLTGGSPEIVNNLFSENTAGEGGGAVYCASSALITCNRFESNTAGDYGGAIGVYASTAQITRNTFTSNDGGDRGGAVWIGNSPPGLDLTVCSLINNLFVQNQVIGTGGGAMYAEGIWPYSTYANIVNNTFAENQAINSDQYNGNGGAVRAFSNDYRVTADLTLVNNIFYKNKARDWDQAWSVGNSLYMGEYCTGSLLFSGAFSDVSGSESYHYVNITPDAGCITGLIGPNDPPMFVNGYHLKTSTPFYTPTPMDHGLDPGENQYFSGVPAIYLDGLPRPINISTVTPNGDGGCCDMGAYEAQE